MMKIVNTSKKVRANLKKLLKKYLIPRKKYSVNISIFCTNAFKKVP